METFTYLQKFEIDHGEIEEVSPLSFYENIRQSIETPISYLMRTTSRALIFEFLEKHDLSGLLSALSGLMLFQDGVFADAYCDSLFINLEKTSGSRSRFLRYQAKTTGNYLSRKTHKNLIKIALCRFGRLQERHSQWNRPESLKCTSHGVQSRSEKWWNSSKLGPNSALHEHQLAE